MTDLELPEGSVAIRVLENREGAPPLPDDGRQLAAVRVAGATILGGRDVGSGEALPLLADVLRKCHGCRVSKMFCRCLGLAAGPRPVPKLR